MTVSLFSLQALASIVLASVALASPFTDTLLRDEALWGDGQAEYSFYDATEVRYGVPRESEVRHILVRENFLPNTKVKANDWQTLGAYPVIKLNQIIRVPTGVYRYDQMHSGFWNAADGKLEKFSLASIDSCGNSYKEGRINRNRLTYDANTYWENMDRVHREVNLPESALFYDELPFKLRLLDWGNVTEFTAPLTGSVITSKVDGLAFEPAKFTVEATDDAKRVTVDPRRRNGRLRVRTRESLSAPRVGEGGRWFAEIEGQWSARLLESQRARRRGVDRGDRSLGGLRRASWPLRWSLLLGGGDFLG